MSLMVQPANSGMATNAARRGEDGGSDGGASYIAPAVNDGHLTFVTVFFESRFSINTLQLCFNALVRL